MADAKKPAGKPAPKPAPSSGIQEGEYVFFAIVAVIILFIIIPAVVKFFGYGDVKYSVPENLGGDAAHFFSTTVEVVSAVSIFLILLIVMAIVYTKFRYKDIIEAYSALQSGTRVGNAEMNIHQDNIASFQAAGPDPRWLEIEHHMASGNQSDWRVAVLEADIILYDMLEQMGYPGDSVADMLKAADPASFTTIQDAWSAHKIRNIIAHEGANYVLTREEADRAIRLFKKVFEEFYFI